MVSVVSHIYGDPNATITSRSHLENLKERWKKIEVFGCGKSWKLRIQITLVLKYYQTDYGWLFYSCGAGRIYKDPKETTLTQGNR